MLRLIAIVLVGALAALWIEPAVDRDERRLSLRVRESDEVSAVLIRALDHLRARAQDGVAKEVGRRLPPVGSGDDSDRLTEADRARLDRLVEEKTRD